MLTTSTLSDCVRILLEESQGLSTAHEQLSTQLNELTGPLRDFQRDAGKSRDTCLKNGTTLQKTLQSAEGTLQKAKSDFEKAKEGTESAESEYNASAGTKNEAKAKKKFEGETKKAQGADKKYSEAVQNLQGVQDRYYNNEMPAILREMQKIDEDRIDQTKSCLEAAARAMKDVGPLTEQSAEKFLDATSRIDRQTDIETFVNATKTGAEKPDSVQYESYTPPSRPPAAAAATPAAAAPPASTPGVGAGRGAAPTQQRAPPASAPRAAPPASEEIVFALYDYDATESTELTFKAGAKISVLKKDESGWWEGKLNNGQSGMFPSNFVSKDAPAGGPPAAAAAATPAFPKCRALYTYEAEEAAELTIHEGEILTVEGEDEGWYNGQNEKGQRGRYPSNYVEML